MCGPPDALLAAPTAAVTDIESPDDGSVWVVLQLSTIARPIRKCNGTFRLNNKSSGYVSIIGLLSSSSRTKKRVAAALCLLPLGGLCAALMSLPLAETSHFPGQYQNGQVAVSRAAFTVLLASKSGTIIAPIRSANALDTEQNGVGQVRVDQDGQMAVAQYQPSESEHEDRRLMFRIALGLGLAYVGFLACWIWATRRRSGPPRH